MAVISPSQPVVDRKDNLLKAISSLEEKLDLKIVLAPHAMDEFFYSAGKVERRLDDIHWAFSDPEIKAIFMSVGGGTAIDLVDKLDYELISKNPKVLTGISDATTLLNAINRKTGLVSFLGMELTDFGIEEMDYEIEWMRKVWFEEGPINYWQNSNWRDFDNLPNRYRGWREIKPGRAEGKLVGGNLSSFYSLLNTPYMPETKDNILVIETYKLAKKQIHQALQALRLKGFLDEISGLIIGYLIGSDDPTKTGNDRDIAEIVQEVCGGYSFPVMEVGEIGHNVENLILPIGGKATFDTNRLEFSVESAVEE